MTPGEAAAYRAGIEAVRAFAQDRLLDHQARIRRRPNHRWSVTIGFLGGFGGVVDFCNRLVADQLREGDS